MLVLLRQELYKLFHRTYLLYTVIGLIAFQSLRAFGAGTTRELRESFINDYGVFVISIMVFLFAVNIWTMEYQTGAMKLIIARQYNRSLIYLSKLITVFVYHIILLAISYITVIAGKAVFGLQGVTDPFASGLANLLATWPIVGILTVLIVLIRSAAIPMALGITTSLGGYIFNLTMGEGLISRFDFMKYNPINTLTAGSELLNSRFEQMTHLDLTTIVSLNVFYTLVMLVIASVAFSHQNN